jgi:carbon-monoxide dehydrogenase small subunit
VTLEGLEKEGVTPLQSALVEGNAFQCGFCAPGVVLVATALLRENPHPSAREIREAISGNLCRCTGYQSIVRAIQAFAREVDSERS